MPYIEIPEEQVKDFRGKPLEIIARNDKGEPEYENPDEKDEAKKKLKMMEAKTSDVVREILLLMNAADVLKGIQAATDSFEAHVVWNRVNREHTNGVIKLRDKEYKWLHEYLDRKVPLRKEAKDSGFSERTVANHLYALNEWRVRYHLKSLEARKKDDEEVKDGQPDE